MKIEVNRTANMTPHRSWDYSATDAANYEPGCPQGLGATPWDAIDNLVEEMESKDMLPDWSLE